MIFFHPEDGPNAADLAAIELRREGDQDVADLLQLIRKLVDGPNHAEVRLQELRDDLSSMQDDLDEAREELREFRRKSGAKELERLERENAALKAKLASIRVEASS